MASNFELEDTETLQPDQENRQEHVVNNCNVTQDGEVNSISVDVPHLSKKQLRKQKKRETWSKYKSVIRKKEKEKKKLKRKNAIERGEEVPSSRKSLKKNSMANSMCKVGVVIDCSLDSYMSEKDIMTLGRQIQFSYSSNRRAVNPIQLHVCGIKGQLKTRLDGIGDYRNWDIYYDEKDYWDVFDHKDIVYLSSESPNVLKELEPEKFYIIGGLVDHNHHKGLCHKLAEERGINHAQLPISEYINMKTRKVLTINHVFEILLKYTETKDWQKAFFTVIPQRKGAEIKEKDKLSLVTASDDEASELSFSIETQSDVDKEHSVTEAGSSTDISTEIRPSEECTNDIIQHNTVDKNEPSSTVDSQRISELRNNEFHETPTHTEYTGTRQDQTRK